MEKEMATHSSVLAWRIPGMAEPGGLPFVKLHRGGHDWSDLAAAAYTYIYMYTYMATCISLKVFYHRASLVSQCKEPACQCWRSRGFSGWVEEMSWRRKWQPTPVFLPGESHGQRSLEGFSPQDWKSRTWLSNETTTILPQARKLMRHGYDNHNTNSTFIHFITTSLGLWEPERGTKLS